MITCRTAYADNPGYFSALALASEATATLVLLVPYSSNKVADTLILSLLFSLGLTMIDGSVKQGACLRVAELHDITWSEKDRL